MLHVLQERSERVARAVEVGRGFPLKRTPIAALGGPLAADRECGGMMGQVLVEHLMQQQHLIPRRTLRVRD
jgi:hypothetical protein